MAYSAILSRNIDVQQTLRKNKLRKRLKRDDKSRCKKQAGWIKYEINQYFSKSMTKEQIK